jgi:urea transport system permease protein
MVIFAAVGGKMSLLGAVYGTLVVNTGKSLFSETFPQLWLFAMGGLFIAVVMLFPNGLAGIWEVTRDRFKKFQAHKRTQIAPGGSEAIAISAEAAKTGGES